MDSVSGRSNPPQSNFSRLIADVNPRPDGGILTSRHTPQPVSGDERFSGERAATVTADQIHARIVKELEVPASNHTAAPGVVTEILSAEASANRIALQLSRLLELFMLTHAGLNTEDLVLSFMLRVHAGISQGHREAQCFLDSLGVLAISGVRDSVEQTRALIDQKLLAFADAKLHRNGRKTKLPVEPANDDEPSIKHVA